MLLKFFMTKVYHSPALKGKCKSPNAITKSGAHLRNSLHLFPLHFVSTPTVVREAPRRRLRALRVRLRRIYPPLRFGAYPLRRCFAPYNHRLHSPSTASQRLLKTFLTLRLAEKREALGGTLVKHFCQPSEFLSIAWKHSPHLQQLPRYFQEVFRSSSADTTSSSTPLPRECPH